MPGIPKKRYCKPCKRRKLKCDEKWPECSACIRAGMKCPGPSTLMKFVVNNSHKVSADEEDGVASSSRSDDCKNLPLASSGPLVLAERPSPASVRHTSQGSEFRSYRLLNTWTRPIPMDSCDRIASRLASLINMAPENSIEMFKPLNLLPARLSLSKCLQDSVAYWCSSWVDHLQGLQEPSSTSWNHYGNLLRSLQRAIKGPQALRIETITAATILYKTGDVFNLGHQFDFIVMIQHSRGIATLARQRGIPDLNDPLELLLAYEQQRPIETLNATPFDDARFYDTAPWMKFREGIIEKVLLSENGQQIDIFIEKATIRYFGGILQDLRLIHKDPDSLFERAKTIHLDMYRFISKIEALFPDHWAYAEEVSGRITETIDPDFFVGKRYNLQSHRTFEILSKSLEAPLIPCLIIRRLNYLHDEPPDEYIETKYRKFCERLWMFIPYLKTQDPLYIASCLHSFGRTLEAATEEEQDHIFNFIEDMNVTREFGKDREEIVINLRFDIDVARGAKGDFDIDVFEIKPDIEVALDNW